MQYQEKFLPNASNVILGVKYTSPLNSSHVHIGIWLDLKSANLAD